MTYLPTLGAIDASLFNSTKYPGVCKPTNETTLKLVYELQNQLNRIAKMKGTRIIAVDGDIGPGTIASVSAAAPSLAPLQFDTSSCIAVATRAVDIALRARTVADGLGAPAKVSAPAPSKAPTIVTPDGLELKGPPPVGASLLDSVKNLGMPMMLLLAAGIIGAGYFLTRPAKGGSSKPSVRYRTRTKTRYIRRYGRSR